MATREVDDTTLVDGAPVLVVEILSPNDVQEQIDEKIDEYLAAGVLLVWVIDPHDRTVLIYRKGEGAHDALGPPGEDTIVLPEGE